MKTFQKEHETLETLSVYEKRPGQAQRFLARVNKNFRWPTSMPEYIRRGTFMDITDNDDEEFGLEVGLNYLFFYNALDNGEFAEHKNEWVTVHKQRAVQYGQMYDDDSLSYILEVMPGAVQLPVDQTKLPRNPPAKMVTVQRVTMATTTRFEYALNYIFRIFHYEI